MKMTTGLMAVALLVGTLPALAAEKGSIAYVNLQRVITGSKTGQRDRAEFDKVAKEKQAALQKEADKIKAFQQDLQKNQLLMSDQQKQEKQKEFQTKVEALQKMENEARQSMAKLEGELLSKAATQIRAVAKDIAKEEKFTIILGLPESAVLYADDAVDLTNKVIQRYDSKSK